MLDFDELIKHIELILKKQAKFIFLKYFVPRCLTFFSVDETKANICKLWITRDSLGEPMNKDLVLLLELLGLFLALECL